MFALVCLSWKNSRVPRSKIDDSQSTITFGKKSQSRISANLNSSFRILNLEEEVSYPTMHECTKNEIHDLTILKLETRVGGSRASQKVTFV